MGVYRRQNIFKQMHICTARNEIHTYHQLKYNIIGGIVLNQLKT